MCGIAGILSPNPSDNHRAAMKMAQALAHRGPDANGVWSDSEAGVALAHARLSIIDLSPNGAQPMISQSGRYVISFNGEIYNYLTLRRELEKQARIQWQGHSDTEVLLAVVERFGIEQTLEKVNGMFAFALWDKKDRTLLFARDRMGEKPLYIGWIGENIVFASELKAFYSLPAWEGSINRRALGFLLRYGYVPTPLCIYEQVFKLPQARHLTVKADQCKKLPTADQLLTACRRYWDIGTVATEGLANPFNENESLVLDRLENLLTKSVRERMIADVPVGAMLSGGIDSSLITALMQRCSSKPVNTFTIGFSENDFDEAKFARPVAAHLGCNHTEITLSHKDALALIPKLPEIYDEPFADPSQLPTVLVSSIARKNVTVALSGDGGDELFGGYARYWAALQVWPIINRIPPALRISGGRALTRLAKAAVPFGALKFVNQMRHRIWRLGNRISADNFDTFYANLQSLSLTPASIAQWPCELPLIHTSLRRVASMNIEQRMMFIDQCAYLADDVLVKTDRASMSVSLELRVPLLDRHVIEFAWRLPAHMRRKRENGKLLLRRLLYRYVPRRLIDRPKKGFDIPQDEWLRGPLRSWMMDLLAPTSLRNAGYIDAGVVQQLTAEHLAGSGDHGYALWPLLMFQAWLAKQ